MSDLPGMTDLPDAPIPPGKPDAPVPPNPPRRSKRAKRPDRWAHRRGEPRVFAFLWTLYLLGATLLGFGSLGAIGAISADTYRMVARVILVSVAVGVVVVWPMTRLSQVTPRRRGTRVAWADFIVIAAPIQAVVLPQVFLPFGWPIWTVVAISAILTAWVMAIAGLLAIVFGPESASVSATRRPPRRGWLWMLVIVVAAFTVPAFLLVSGATGAMDSGPGGTSNGIRRLWLASPATGVYELTRRRVHTSIAPTLNRGDWLMVGLPAAAGVVLWVLAAGLQSGRDPRASRPSGV
jgi:MFS family permease